MKKIERILVVLLGLASISFLSNESGRKIACIDGLSPIVVSSGTIPIESELFSHIQDKTLKDSTISYYKMLKETQSNYYSGLQTARLGYGLSGGIWGQAPLISYAPIDLTGQSLILTKDTLWGGFLSNRFLKDMNTNTSSFAQNQPGIIVQSPMIIK